MARNPYIRIFEAAKNGVGVRLTAEECFYLAQDDSIVQVAMIKAEGEVSDGGGYVVTREGFADIDSEPGELQ